MKKPGKGALILASGAIGALLVHAQLGEPQPSAQTLATVSFSAAVMQTNDAKRDFAALQRKFAPRESQLEALNGEVESLRKTLAEQKDRLSDAELNAQTQALNAKEKQLQRAEEDYRSDSQSDGQEAFRRIAQRVFVFLQDYAKEHHYSVVIDRGNGETPLVLYATDAADITGQIVSAYNAKTSGAPPASGDVIPKAPPSKPIP